MVPSTPWECLERIALDVASLVPDEESIVRVEVEFDGDAFAVQFVSTPYRPCQLYDPSLSTRLSVTEEQVARVRQALGDYCHHAKSWENELESLTLSVAIDGSFSMGQTHPRRRSL